MPISKEVKIGKGTRIYHPALVNLYDCEIGRDCKIGAFVVIQKGVVIGNGVKILDSVFIPEGVTVEDEVLIGPHVCFTNDRYPRATNPDGTLQDAGDWKLVKSKVCRKASIGANATIVCGVEIGEGALVGAGSVVTRDVPSWTIVIGNPARILRKMKDFKR